MRIVEELERQRRTRCVEILNIMNLRGEKKILKVKVKELLEHDDKIDCVSDIHVDESPKEQPNYLITWLVIIEAFQKIQKKEKEQIEVEKGDKLRDVELWTRSSREEEKFLIEPAKQVRFIPATLQGWDTAKDKLKGNEEYGDLLCSTKAWARKFDEINFSTLTVTSGDKTYTKEYTREEINGKIATDPLLKDKSKMKKSGGANVFIYHDQSKEDKYIDKIDKSIQENKQKKIKEREALEPATEVFEAHLATLKEKRM